MAVQEEIMAEDKRKKWNQWAEVLWNIILIVGCMYFFCRLLADMNESGFARMAAENRILLPVLGVFLLNMAASTWKNIQKPGACDEQGGSAPEKEAGTYPLRFEMDVAISEDFVRELLYYGPEVRVIEPESLKRMIRRAAKDIADMYEA